MCFHFYQQKVSGKKKTKNDGRKQEIKERKFENKKRIQKKVVKVLGNLGFRSTPLALVDLLKKSSQSKTMYAPLSSIALLYYYANRGMYVQLDTHQSLWIKDRLDSIMLDYPNSPLLQLLQVKMLKNSTNLDQCLQTLYTAKKICHKINEKGIIKSSSIKEYNQFRLFILFEIGW